MALDKKHDEQELERYGVWVKAGPDQIDDHDSQGLELMDIEDSENDEVLITEEEEKLLGELEESALPDFSDFEDSFDDTFDAGGLEDDYSLSADTGMAGGITDDPESRELLHRIEDDLSALRKEIRQLKEELTGLRVPAVAPAPADAGGFFDEEEDETIALTGDELDNILDSAEMREEVAEEVPAAEEAEEAGDDLGIDEISFDDEDTIDLSGDFPEVAVDEDFQVEDSIDEDDPALSILGSPEEPEESGDPDTLEIDIPGLDETISLDEPEVVSIDEIGDDSGADEITDLDDFDIEEISLDDLDAGDGSATSPLDDLADMPEEEEITLDAGEEVVLTEAFDTEDFDEGEEVEIDLGDEEDILEAEDDADMLGVEMEEISLDDFGLEEDEASVAGEPSDSDVLAVEDGIEEIDLEDFGDMEADDEFEEMELDSVLAEGIEEGIGTPEEPVELASVNDLVVEEIDLEAVDDAEEMDIDLDGDDSFEEISLDDESVMEEISLDDEPVMEEISLEDEPAIEEISLDDEPVMEEISLDDEPVMDDISLDGEPVLDEISLEEEPALEEISFDDEPVMEEISLDDDVEEIALEEVEPLEDDLTSELSLDEEIPEISIDDAIDEIETVEEFSLDEEGDLIEDLETESEEEIQVTLPDDDFDELPGTEELDLTSLDALAAAPDLTEEAAEEITELPEMEDEIDELPELDDEDSGIMDLDEGGMEDITEFDLGDEADEVETAEPLVPTPQSIADKAKAALEIDSLPGELKDEIKEVLKYMDQLLESLPDEKIQEFARSEHFEVYKKIFEELGISD